MLAGFSGYLSPSCFPVSCELVLLPCGGCWWEAMHGPVLGDGRLGKHQELPAPRVRKPLEFHSEQIIASESQLKARGL